ncbi:uncharacterized protein lcorl isoform X3 [Acipenser ruthenus]|uniref:uncharacterized protein lcorl isoform X3 n=1 Tax=Acipenser ruthenus TaxID=7906 RepID=UPI0027417ABC|nr:uncharacterized protein lcorl isoform X3 [Acipenser ruthenus]
MAAQCRSSKCTAERKGFRRELESWRHKLVHCVGFESILEGLYGPRLLRDLSIFEDCEPDEVKDWSMDENCSFCKLQIEKVNTPPTEESLSQGQSNTEQIECQAEKILHAIFQKKDLPQNCDLNIPLVAQELMKKMIHQFAIEYASKSYHIQETNVSCADLDSVCSSLQQPQDQDGPLDLTVNRNQQNVEQVDGVLDLSKKTSATSASMSSNVASGSRVPVDVDPLPHLESTDEKLDLRRTALEMVMSSLCLYHKQLLLNMLRYMYEDYSFSAIQNKDYNRPFSYSDTCFCSFGNKVHQEIHSFREHKMTDRRCVQSCRVNAYSVPNFCICLKNLHCLSCQSTAIGCINKMVSHRSCDAYSHYRCSCSYQNYSCAATTATNPPFTRLKMCNQLEANNDCCRRSPSPPPLSPIAIDNTDKYGERSTSCPVLVHNRSEISSNLSPSHLPHDKESNVDFLTDVHEKKSNKETNRTPQPEGKIQPANEEGDACSEYPEEQLEQTESGSLIHDLMERINKKLKPLEKESSLANLAANENVEENENIHLGDIITAILQKDNGKNDYNLKELLIQHEQCVENKTIQTHFCRRHSLDLPSSRRQALQIKREIASHDQSFVRRNPAVERNEKKTDNKSSLAPSMETMSLISDPENVSAKNGQPANDKQVPFCELPSLGDPVKMSPYESSYSTTESHPEMSISTVTLETPHKSGDVNAVEDKQKNVEAKGTFKPENVGGSRRAQRNIVPPERLSMYVTEPRKMYLAACFPESLFIQKSPKVKRNSLACGSNSAATNAPCNGIFTQWKDQIKNCEAANVTPGLIKQALPENVPLNLCNRLTRRNKVREPAVPKEANASKSSSITCNEKDGTKQCAQKRKRHFVSSSSILLRSSVTHVKENAQSNSNSTESSENCSSITNSSSSISKTDLQTVSDSFENNSLLTYTSPIRLMYFSQINSSDGVKYKLTSSFSNTSKEGGSLSPCFESVVNGEEANVLQETRNDEKAMYSQNCEAGNDGVGTNKDVYATEAERALSSNEKNSECDDQKEKENHPGAHVEKKDFVLKRKPGRPKKLGPQIEQRVKRPIGRPPKHKRECCESVSSKSDAVDNSSADCSLAKDYECNNKTIKVTVVYGRSRRIKRLVSEGDDNISKDTDFQNDSCENQRENEDSEADLEEPYRSDHSNQTSEKKVEDNHFDFVRPVTDKDGAPRSSSNIICQNQKVMAAMRKPGRPAKVKISGISVTVNTVSPKQRKICICRELSDVLDEESEPIKLEFDDNQSATKEQAVKLPSSDNSVGQLENEDKKVRNKKNPVLPVRYSNRVRKPSIHFLHSVATSSAFSHSNALLLKSRKLLLNKADNETTRHRLASLEVPSNDTSEVTSLETENKNPLTEQVNFSHVFELPANSIFASNAALRWWSISTSRDHLQEELHRRFQQITNSWHSVDIGELGNEQRERESTVQDRTWAMPRSELQENQVSAVKMLFQKHCDMNKLSAWFMQTTETQSLAIVRKTNACNPSKVLHYKCTRAANRAGICPNPLAECLSKRIKKFAQASPTSPARHFQMQDTMRKRRLHVRRRLLLGKQGTTTSTILNKQTKTFGENTMRRNEKDPWRRKSKFMYRAIIYKRLARRKNTLALPLVKTSPDIQTENHETTQLFPDTMPSSFIGIQSHSLNLSTTTGKLNIQQQQQSTTEELDPEEKICTNRWSPETFKECRVFLTKLNPPEKQKNSNIQSQNPVLDKSVKAGSSKTDCAIEESNLCTVKLYDVLSASKCVFPVNKEREDQTSKLENETSRKKVASEGTRHSPKRNVICKQTNNDEPLCDKSNRNFETGTITMLTRKRTSLNTRLEEAAKKRRQSLNGWPSGRNSHWLLAKDNAHLKVSSQSAETTEHPADTCMMDMLSHQEEAEVVSHGLKENTWEVCMLSPAFLQLTGLRDLAGNYWVMVSNKGCQEDYFKCI